MDLGSFLLIIALAILAGIFVSQPFFKVSRGEPLVLKDQVALIPDHERSALLAERDRLLASLSELDFDQALGKIPAKDYLPQRAELLRAGAEILRKLDAHALEQGMRDLSAEDCTEVTTCHTGAGKNTGRGAELDEVDLAINARRRQKEEKLAGICPKCGNVVQKSDIFCSRCGAML